jgi:hypothetical protein
MNKALIGFFLYLTVGISGLMTLSLYSPLAAVITFGLWLFGGLIYLLYSDKDSGHMRGGA